MTGVVLEHRDVQGSGRALITGLFLLGQWLVPATVIVAEGFGVRGLTPTLFLWIGLLAGAMAGMAYVSARRVRSPPAPPSSDPEPPQAPGDGRQEPTPPNSGAGTLDREERRET